MFNAFNRVPKRTPYRSFDVKSPEKGTHDYRSIDLPVPQMPLHWFGRNVPCFGPGCPLCPQVARPMIFFPCVKVGQSGLKLLLINSRLELEQLAKVWQLGWSVKLARGEKRTKIVESKQSLHEDVGHVEDRDIQETLARMFWLPSPEDYGDNEEAWVRASIEAIKEEIRNPRPKKLPKS